MDIAAGMMKYDFRATSASLGRTLMAPQYGHSQPYTGCASNTLVASHQQIQHSPFGFHGAYPMATPNEMVPAFAHINYIQQRPPLHAMQQAADGSRGGSYSPGDRQGVVKEHQSRSPPIKQEPLWNGPPGSQTFQSPKTKTITSPLPSGTAEVDFGTEVDTLMKTIQAKASTEPSQQSSPVIQSRPVVGARFTPPHLQPPPTAGMQTIQESKFKPTDEALRDAARSPKGSRKRYVCTIEGCSRSFYQKTHLDIHIRAHTGDKPYECKEPGCGRSFSQLGNLKTHERRHTGERPFACDVCGKRFAQRGNVRAHKIVHDQAKPYTCRLDDCGKPFTQLGNLKSHQNKFHIPTIRNLTSKFASVKDGDVINADDKELWEYFANLYKNSNKGIKGRGKDRKVESRAGPSASRGARSLGASASGYAIDGAGRGPMAVGAMLQSDRADAHYEMFDADDASQAGSHSGAGGSVGTGYEDAPSDGFEDTERTGELAFGDRIY